MLCSVLVGKKLSGISVAAAPAPSAQELQRNVVHHEARVQHAHLEQLHQQNLALRAEMQALLEAYEQSQRCGAQPTAVIPARAASCPSAPYGCGGLRYA